MGMKREAVQEERQRTRERDRDPGIGNATGPSPEAVENCTSSSVDMPIDVILEAEKRFEFLGENQASYEQFNNRCNNKHQMRNMVEWAKRVPHFTSLHIEDQALLLRASWNELMIASCSHRSVDVEDCLVLASGALVLKHTAQQSGLGAIFDRILTELVQKMKTMRMDKTELACLRAIILFNPEVHKLQKPMEVDLLREKVYTALDEYTRQHRPDEPGRFAKLLLRLPALRSIGLKSVEHTDLFQLLGDISLDDTNLLEMLKLPSDS